MAGHVPALSLVQDERYHITWCTPDLARFAGIHPGMHASTFANLPWEVTRRYIQAAERCLERQEAVAWFEPGGDGRPQGVAQVIPLPRHLGLAASFVLLPDGHPVPDDEPSVSDR